MGVLTQVSVGSSHSIKCHTDRILLRSIDWSDLNSSFMYSCNAIWSMKWSHKFVRFGCLSSWHINEHSFSNLFLLGHHTLSSGASVLSSLECGLPPKHSQVEQQLHLCKCQKVNQLSSTWHSSGGLSHASGRMVTHL